MNLHDALRSLAARLCLFGVLVGARAISPGDEDAFHDPALESTPQNRLRRRASGAARRAAAPLLRELGVVEGGPVGRAPSGAPVWPAGLVGSIAHDADTAVAVVARRCPAIAGLGIDIEPAEPLPADLAEFVLTADERRRLDPFSPRARLAFAAKESVYKAVHPRDGAAPEYADIVCAPDFSAAKLTDGRSLSLTWIEAPKIVVVAILADVA